jgi:uncharacterized protein YegP (UPF0339 family)
MAAGKFEISKDKAGKFRWHLKAANGEIIAASQAYDTKAGAKYTSMLGKSHSMYSRRTSTSLTSARRCRGVQERHFFGDFASSQLLHLWVLPAPPRAGRPRGEQGRPDQLVRRGLGRSGSR